MHPASHPYDDELVRGRHTLGEIELIHCSDGTYLLDGGAMFGVVPKTLWQKRTPADPDNRILLGLNTVVVRTGSAVVLIETGIGNKQSPKMREIFQNQERLPASLGAAGILPNDVTHVINTHLHFDHCGWNTTLHPDGSRHADLPERALLRSRGRARAWTPPARPRCRQLSRSQLRSADRERPANAARPARPGRLHA